MTEHTSLAAALVELQTKLPRIEKSERAKVETKQGGSYSYTYADLANLSEAILPILADLGMSFTARPAVVDGRFSLVCRLWHTSGQYLEGEYPLPSNGTAQSIGSAMTYGRRYSLCAMTGVAPDDDDDGAAAEAEAQAKRQQAQPRQQQRTAKKASAYSKAGGRPAGDDTIIEKDSGRLAALHIKLQEYGIGGAANRDVALAYMSEVIGHQLESSKLLTVAEFRQVMERLDAEIKEKQHEPAAEYDPTAEPDWQPPLDGPQD